MTYQEIKKEIIDTINLPEKVEPHFEIGRKYFKLTSQLDKEIYLQIIKELIVQGDLKQRFCCLIGIQTMKKEQECKNEIKVCVDNFNSVAEIKLVARLSYVCAVISEEWSLDFIRRIITEFKTPFEKFKSIYDKYNIYSLSIRYLAETNRWMEFINYMNVAYSLFDDKTFIDNLAFFKYKRGEVDFERLKKSLFKENSDRVLSLSSLIEMRYKNYI